MEKTILPPTDAATFQVALRRLGACESARDWARGKDYATAWATCPRPDWLLWLARRLGTIDKRTSVTLACLFARQALHLVQEGGQRPRKAIETAEAWLRGEATVAECRAAADAAYADAAYAAAAAYAAYAAYATYARQKIQQEQANLVRTHIAQPTW